MAKVAEVAAGAALIGASFLVPGSTIFAGMAVSSLLMGVGASAVMTGIGSLIQGSPQGGVAVSTKNPIAAWNYVYGTMKVGGTTIFEVENSSQGTSSDKQCHRVMVLASHPCQGLLELRIDNQKVLLTPGAHGGYVSYSPTQYTVNIASISRSNGLATMTLSAPINNYNGLVLWVKGVADNTFNGLHIVTQPNPSDATTFTFACGGPDTTSSGGQAETQFGDYKDKIYVEFLNGTQTSTFVGLLPSGTSWGSSDVCKGRAVVYVRMGYDSSVFPGGMPEVSFVVQGKNNILDPRTGNRGFTNNAALCIADFMSMPVAQGGFGLTIGTDIPTAGLIAAANVCDEPVNLAAGGTIPRYQCDTFFTLVSTRGEILKNLLSSCAGRLSYQGGTYNIVPGAWVGSTLSLSTADLVGPIKWSPRLSIRDVCNGVKGTYVTVANEYQQGDIPPYMQDADHGYASDFWLAEDGGERIFQDVQLPCTVNAATAQRLAKIDLLRTRFQGRGTFKFGMRAYQAVALDVISFTHPRYGWVNKNFEVLSSRFVQEDSPSGNGAKVLCVELDVAETDPSIYAWSTTEELSPDGYIQIQNAGNQTCPYPENVVVYSGPATTVGGVTYPSTIALGADGVARNSLYVAWTPPNDDLVLDSGKIEVQWQPAGASYWIALAAFDGSLTNCFINNVSDNQSYNVQIRAVNHSGIASEWIFSGPHVVSATQSIFTSSSGFNDLGSTVLQSPSITYSYTNSSITFTWTAYSLLRSDGTTLSMPSGSLTYSGLTAATAYYTYWFIDAATGALGQTNSNPPPTAPSPTEAAEMGLDGRVSIGLISVTTLAGTGSGGGTGGGYGICPEAAELVEVQGKGQIPAGQVKPGDMIKGRSFHHRTDTYRKVKQIRTLCSSSWRMVNGHRVSPGEPVYVNNQWMPAFRAPGATVDTIKGTKVHISVDSDVYNEQNFYLVSGTQLLIHNWLPPGYGNC